MSLTPLISGLRGLGLGLAVVLAACGDGPLEPASAFHGEWVLVGVEDGGLPAQVSVDGQEHVCTVGQETIWVLGGSLAVSPLGFFTLSFAYESRCGNPSAPHATHSWNAFKQASYSVRRGELRLADPDRHGAVEYTGRLDGGTLWLEGEEGVLRFEPR